MQHEITVIFYVVYFQAGPPGIPRPSRLELEDAHQMGRRLSDVGEASSLCSLGKKQSEDASPTPLADGAF